MKSLSLPLLFSIGCAVTALPLSSQTQSPITVSVPPTSTNESAGVSQITLQLSSAATNGAEVTANLLGISASELDFTPLTSTRVIFAPGATSASIAVPLTNDTIVETIETFQLSLSAPLNLTIPVSDSSHSIISDDAGLILPSFFSDGMVLQRNKGAAVWGFSLPGSIVTVSFAGQTLQATSDPTGRFQVTFNNLAASSVGRSLVFSSPGIPSLTINDVLVGEVWLAAGQSNMDFPLSFLPTDENNNEIATSNDPLLRVFVPIEQAFPEPQSLVDGDWFAATPGDTSSFPALAYYVGRRLRAELGVPVAFLECAWGGQPIAGFTSEEKLATFPEGIGTLGTRDFFYNLYATGQLEENPRFFPNLAGQLHNGMIAPMKGYGMQGIFWYQGEFNALSFNSDEYGPKLKALAEDLRSLWADDLLPFYYVQLPNFEDPNRPLWINVQDDQRLALDTIPNSGMIVGNDIGDITDIHPTNKSAFADRLVRWPLAKIYGQTNLIPSGPIFKRATRIGSTITVSFDYSQGLKTRNGSSLGGFEVRASGGEWVDANATISGETVFVSSPSISSPVGVRYAWLQNPATANLVNQVNLPASIFEAVPTTNVTQLYRDSFNDSSLSSNPGSGGGLSNLGTTGDGWRESLGQISYSGIGAGNRANAYTTNDFGIDQGFTLEVDYSLTSLAPATNNHFSFGLFRNYAPNRNNGLIDPTTNSYGIGFNLTPGAEGNPQGLVFTQSGTSSSTSNLESAFITESGTHTLSLTLVPDETGGANWSYSYDGEPPVTGNIPVFDFSSADYSFVTNARDGGIAKSIQQIRLATFDIGLPILTVSAEPTNEGLIGLFLNFTLSQPSTSEVSVQFDTVDGVALEGQDYLPFTNRVISFAPGETFQTEILTMVDDAVIEPDETFSVTLSNPIGLALSSVTAPLVIVNDDSVLDDFGDSYGLPTAERLIASDGDNDGNALFLEYAFNLDPTVAASPDYVPGALLPFNNEPFGLPVLRMSVNSAGDTEIRYQYIRRTNSFPKVEYITEISSDGANFTPAEPDEVRRISSFWEEVTVLIGCTDSDISRCFARVRIIVEDDDGDGA